MIKGTQLCSPCSMLKQVSTPSEPRFFYLQDYMNRHCDSLTWASQLEGEEAHI